MSRFLLTIILAVTCAFAGTNVAAADSNSLLPDHKDSVSSRNAPNFDLRLFTYPPQTQDSSRVNQQAPELLRETAQLYVPVATACYTYAGPVCAMVQAVSPGSSCACYFNGGSLSGIAW